MDISYYSSVSQLKEGVVNDESIWGGGVEGGEISVPWHVTIEIGMREGSGMKGGSVDRSVLCPLSLQCHTISQVQIANILGQFLSSILINEDKWVVLCVVNVELDPVFPRVIWVFFVAVTD